MTDTTTPHVRPFADFLVKQGGGRLNIEAAEALAQVVLAVTEVGKDGTFTLQLKVSRTKGGALEITDKVSVKLPEFASVPAMWWADDDGNLVRRDPNQPELFDGPQAVDNQAAPAAPHTHGGNSA